MTDQTTYRPGDRVRVELGLHTVSAEVLEDHGDPGPGQDHILRIAWTPTDSDERIEQDVPASRVVSEGTSFEEQVRNILEEFAAEINAPGEGVRDDGVDVVVSTPTQQIIVQAKTFPGGVGPSQLRDAKRQVLAAKDALNATEAVLVVPSWNRAITDRGSDPEVSVVTVGQLQDWLARHAPDRPTARRPSPRP